MELIRINSSDRMNPGTTTPAQFSVNAQRTFDGDYLLRSIYCPLAFFNVNANNNRIYFKESNTNKIATLPPGNYTISNLPAAVATALTTASAGTNTFTVTQNALTSFLTITASSVPFSLMFGSNPSITSAWQLLGFALLDTANNLSQTGTIIPNLSSLRTLNFNICNIGTIVDTQYNGHCTFSIPILADTPNGIACYEPDSPWQRIRFDSPTRVLEISVLDDYKELFLSRMSGICYYSKSKYKKIVSLSYRTHYTDYHHVFFCLLYHCLSCLNWRRLLLVSETTATTNYTSRGSNHGI